MGRRGTLIVLIAVIAVIAAVVATVIISSGSDQSSASRPSDAFIGWWFSDGPGPLHIVKQSGHFVSAVYPYLKAGESSVFQTDGAMLILRAPGPDDVRLELKLRPDGRGMTSSYLVNGKKMADYRFHRGTAAEITDFRSQENVNWLISRIDAWFEVHGSYPPIRAVRPDGELARETTEPWPTNPYTGKPMTPGRQPGQYLYSFRDRGFRLKDFGVNQWGTYSSGTPGVTPTPTATSGS